MVYFKFALLATYTLTTHILLSSLVWECGISVGQLLQKDGNYILKYQSSFVIYGNLSKMNLHCCLRKEFTDYDLLFFSVRLYYYEYIGCTVSL